MAMSPTQLSLRKLRDEGYVAEVVEKWIPQARKRKDLFGFIDIMAIHKDSGETLAVQCTTYSNVSSRVNKISDAPTLALVRLADWSVVVHGWRKVKGRWQVREVDLS